MVHRKPRKKVRTSKKMLSYGHIEAPSDSSRVTNPTAEVSLKKVAASPEKPIQEAIYPYSVPKAKIIAWYQAEVLSGIELGESLAGFCRLQLPLPRSRDLFDAKTKA